MKTKILALLLALGVLVLCAVFFFALLFCPLVQIIVVIVGLFCLISIPVYGSYHYFLDILDRRFR